MFVAINDPVHDLLRNVTRRTPLYPRLAAEGFVTFDYEVKPAELPEQYFALAVQHARPAGPRQGTETTPSSVTTLDRAAVLKRANYFDAVRLDRRCLRDLRHKVRKFGPGMLSFELLSYGIGMLRARNDDPDERIHRFLWSHYGHIRSRHEVSYACIRALHRNSLLPSQAIGKEAYDSTNVIYGDALGELQQLWDRRADSAFLEQVACSLQVARRRTEIAAFLNPPLNIEEVLRLHRRAQARWKTPPANARALLRRVEFILDHTTVDSACETVYRPSRTSPSSPASPREPGSAPPADPSGYDGWL
jgi:hypothetical protein